MLLFLLIGVSAFPTIKVTTEPVLGSLACLKYVCNEKLAINPSTCIYYGGESYYMQSCTNSPNFYCPPVFNLLNQTCTTPPDPTYQSAFPGEFCSSDSWCKFGTCQDYSCVAQEFGAGCSSNGECNPGLRCSNQKCVKQLQIGEQGCINDYDCVNNAGCDINVCMGYYSVQNGN